MLADTTQLVVCLFMLGIGLIFWLNDRSNPGSRALAYCLFAAGLATGLQRHSINLDFQAMAIAATSQLMENLAMVFGVEWVFRISQSVEHQNRLSRAARILFRCSQIVLLVFALMSIGYILIFPEYALLDKEGLIKVYPIEFAVFAPLLGSAAILSAIGLAFLLLTQLDPIERIRFRAFLIAAPLFMLSLMLSAPFDALISALGLLIFLGGSVRYLLIQSGRGAAMRQFVSPELAKMVNLQGTDSAMVRERREISVVACDLRGFTAYAGQTDSNSVVELLEHYYAQVGQLATEYGGTVKDHAGDGILILVGAPDRQEGYASRAVNLAEAIITRIQPLLLEHGTRLGLGAGVATGEATIGAIQGAGRLEYVAVGNVVNLAARLCDKAADGEVLCDSVTRELSQNLLRSKTRGAMQMKGFADPIAVFSVEREI